MAPDPYRVARLQTLPALGDFHGAGVIPGGSVRVGRREVGGLGVAELVGRADLNGVLAWRRIPVEYPLPPSIVTDIAAEASFLPRAIVDAHLDAIHSSMLSPSDAGELG